MKLLKIKSDTRLAGTDKIVFYQDGYNYYIVAGEKKRDEKECIYEGTEEDCIKFLDTYVKTK
jgi:uncharacterized protein YpmB